MSYACEVGFFTAAGTTGDQAVTLADSGLTPKSVELFTVGRTVAAPLVGANTIASHGYGTRRGGSTQQVVHSFMSLDGASTSQPSGLCNTGFILRGLTPNATGVAEAYAATLVSFGAGTFTINWSNVVDTASQRVMYIVRGGSDITDALAFSLVGNNSATQNVDLSTLTGGTGWAGKPNLVHLAHGSSGGLTSGVTGAYAFSQAIFNQSESGYATIWLEDGADENVVGDQRSNGPVVMARSGSTGGDPVIDQATVSAVASWPANGFQLAWSLTATLGMVGLAHQGTFQSRIDTVASATSITTVDETASFDPVETYVWGLNMPATASTITADNTALWGGFGIGAFDGTHQGYGGFTEDVAAATSATGQHWSETAGLRSIDAGATPVVQGAATISHPGSGVSRFSWTDADNVVRSFPVLQIGSAGGGTTHTTPTWQSSYVVNDHQTKSWQSSYSCRARQSKSWATSYLARARTAASWQSSYTTRRRAQTTWQSSYITIDHVQRTWASSYTVRVRQSTSWASSYTSRARTEASWDSAYVTRGRVQATWQSSYITRHRAQQTWASGYTTIGRQTSSWPSSYTTQAHEQPTWGSSYLTNAHETTDWQSSYTVTDHATRQWQSSYTVQVTGSSHETAAWETSYTVSARDQTTWQSSWTTHRHATRTWQSSYGIAGRSSSTWSSGYLVRRRAAATWLTGYTVDARLAAAWQSSYTVNHHTTRAWPSGWTVRNTVTGDWQSSYLVTERDTASWPTSYGVSGHVLLSWASRYLIGALIIPPRPHDAVPAVQADAVSPRAHAVVPARHAGPVTPRAHAAASPHPPSTGGT